MKLFLPLSVVIALAIAACNNVGSCPSTITPGASCSGDNLSCPYTITSQTASSTCQGFNDGGPVATSCTCQGGIWACPSCAEDGGGGDATVEGGGDAEPDGGGDATIEGGEEGATEAAIEAGPDSSPAETSMDAPAETSVEGGPEAGDAGNG
jgi:hypothetical protein